MTGDH